MGDPTRIRIVTLLTKGPLHGQAIAGKLGLTPSTISHHLNKLKDINLVYQRRDKNTIYYFLNESLLHQQANKITEWINEKKEVKEVKEIDKQKVIQNFFTKEGKLKNIPSQRKKKLLIFEHMISGLEMGRKYDEKEINEYIQRFHDDYATIRREFIIYHYMYREKGIYELNPQEMWARTDG
jgi:hypothetical protein